MSVKYSQKQIQTQRSGYEGRHSKEIISNEIGLPPFRRTSARWSRAAWRCSLRRRGAGHSYPTKYVKAGARVVPSAEELFGAADLILKVQKPAMNDRTKKHEVDMMKEGACLITFLQPHANLDIVLKLVVRKISAFSMDAVPRISRAQMMDALSSMSTVAGYKAVLLAANSLKRFIPMLSTAAGTVYPAKAVIMARGRRVAKPRQRGSARSLHV